MQWKQSNRIKFEPVIHAATRREWFHCDIGDITHATREFILIALSFYGRESRFKDVPFKTGHFFKLQIRVNDYYEKTQFITGLFVW